MPTTTQTVHDSATQGTTSLESRFLETPRLGSQPPKFKKDVTVLKIGDVLDLPAIQDKFNQVPRDPYVSQGFRYKSIIRVRFGRDGVEVAEHGPLYQPRRYNHVHGGIDRYYDEMPLELAELLSPAVRIFAVCANLAPNEEILVQAQRITATSGIDGRTGYPVVEKWHQDNIDTLGILVVNRQNISGGISLVASDPDGTDLIFAEHLQPGELLLTNDRQTWHNATPIRKVRPDMEGLRDIIILTSPSNRQSDRFANAEQADEDVPLLGRS